MGICHSINDNQIKDKSIESKTEIKKEFDFGAGLPLSKDESDELYTYEPALCKIEFKAFKDGKIKKGSGTGFFCEINNINIPFRKALFTNNHVLDENRIQINKKVEFEYCREKKYLKLQKIERYLQIKNLIIHV